MRLIMSPPTDGPWPQALSSRAAGEYMHSPGQLAKQCLPE